MILEAEVRCKAKGESEWQAEEVELGQDEMLQSVGGLLKQKGWVEGDWLACN